MAHELIGPTGFGGSQVIGLNGTNRDNIRNLIDTRGFIQIPHGPFTTTSSTFPLGRPQSGLTIPGPVASTVPWGSIIRDGIDKLLGGVFGGNGETALAEEGGPIKDRPMVPEFIDVMLSGRLPRGAVSFITLPNGMTGCPSGYHPEKQGKPYCVRNRRMNALNPRALSRASRRVGGFARAVKRARTLKKVCRSL